MSRPTSEIVHDLIDVEKQRLDIRAELCILQLNLLGLDNRFEALQKEIEDVNRD